MNLYYEDKEPEYLSIPTELALSKEIDDAYKFLYGYIKYKAGSRGFICYENDRLASSINKTTRAIERALKALQENEWIHIERHVKKGKLYDKYYHRVIWIYSDYLLAKEQEKNL
ncbi:hypothetical protein KKG72_04690 [bacterium]|nr:hypothetical protein [bacterium]